jgi:hypothetical protein
MSATLEAPTTTTRGKGAKQKHQSLQAPALPQVNLLPPEVRAARGLARTKVWLGVSVLLTIVVCAGLVVLAMFEQQAARDELTEAQAETTQLQAQLAQYAEVPLVLAELDRAERARVLAMGTEILWEPHLDAIAARTPQSARVESLKVLGATVWAGEFAPADVLATSSVATISLTGQAATLADVYTWQRQLEEIPGVSEVVMTQTSLVDGQTMLHYNVAATITLSADAYSGRFLPLDETEEGN